MEVVQNCSVSYSSSKGALNILTELLATEFKDGPYFNTLCLGVVQTPMLELAFPGYNAEVNPKDMAQFIYNFSANFTLMESDSVSIPIHDKRIRNFYSIKFSFICKIIS